MTKAATKKKKKKNKQTTALHGVSTDGTTHIVGIGNLRVVIVHEDGYFFAQGLEIDYAEQGCSLDDVKMNFENGLRTTITQHLRINGNIKKLLKVAPSDVWTDILQDPSADRKFYSHISVHKAIEQLPFEGIQYLIAKDAAQLNV